MSRLRPPASGLVEGFVRTRVGNLNPLVGSFIAIGLLMSLAGCIERTGLSLPVEKGKPGLN